MKLSAGRLISIVIGALFMTPLGLSQSCEDAGLKARNTQYGLYLERAYKPMVTDVQSITYGGKVRYPKELLDGLMLYDCTYQDYTYDPRRRRFFEDDYGSLYIFIAGMDYPPEVFIEPDGEHKGKLLATQDLKRAYFTNNYSPITPYLYKIPQSDLDLIQILRAGAIEELELNNNTPSTAEYRMVTNQVWLDAAASIEWLERLLIMQAINHDMLGFFDRDGFTGLNARAGWDLEFEKLVW